MVRNLANKSLLPLITKILLALGGHANAMSLEEVVSEAMKNDPAYKAARYELEAGLEEKNIGLSNMLPQVSYSRAEGEADYDQTFTTTNQTRNLKTDTINETLQLFQPIINIEAYKSFKQGETRANAAIEKFRGDVQDFYLKVAGAYFDSLGALLNLKQAERERTFYKEKQAQVEEAVANGEASDLDRIQNAAFYDLANARQLEAKQELETRLSTLESYTGKRIASLSLIPETFDFANELKRPLGDWETRARIKSPKIRLAALQARLAELEAERRQARHYPTLSLAVSKSKTLSDSVNTINTENDIDSTQLRLNIPIFEGMRTSASSRQGSLLLSKAQEDLRRAQQEVLVDLQREYVKTSFALERINAYKTAATSAQRALDGTKFGIETGFNVRSDQLEAEKDLFNTQRDLLRVQFEGLVAQLSLLRQAGDLNLNTIREVSQRLSGIQESVEKYRLTSLRTQGLETSKDLMLQINSEDGTTTYRAVTGTLPEKGLEPTFEEKSTTAINPAGDTGQSRSNGPRR